MEKKTPLYNKHIEAKGRMVPFANYLLPVQYPTGIINEHMAVRTKAGLFDVSHMGEITLKGKDALANVQNIITRDISALQIGSIAYSPVCYESGGVVDDILVYKKSETEYLLVVNASNKDKDFAHIKGNLKGDAIAEDISESISQLALQGPLSNSILEKLTKDIPNKYYTFIDDAVLCGVKTLISRTGYTGEDGFEIYCSNEDAPVIWQALLDCCEDLIPCGLGARDTLRLEAAMPLYGHEMDENTLPYEAGIGFFVNTDAKDFIGKEELLKKKDTAKKRVGLILKDRGIAREGAKVYKEGINVGITTSGTHAPYLKMPIAMAQTDKTVSVGDIVQIDIKGKMLNAEVVKLPFYTRKK